VARPVKFTPERQQRVLEAITAGATRHAAALHAGVDDATLYRWLARSESFATLVARAEADVEIRHAANIAVAAQTDWRASAWWLERRRSADYGQQARIELTVRQTAERLGAELGIDPDELIREAERILHG
jgi:transposase-like protein